MSEAARSKPAAWLAATSDRHHPGNRRLFTVERPLMSSVSDRAAAEDALDLHTLAWVDAFRDYGHAACFNTVRDQLARGNDQIMPMFLSDAELQAVGPTLQAYRDRLLELRYLTSAANGQAGYE